MEKKSERLEVRLGYQEKQDFNEACEIQGDTPSGAIRRFINGYVKRSDGDVLLSAWRGAAKRRGRRPLAFAVIFLLIAGGIWAVSQRLPIESDEAVFSARDRNGDGQLDYSEHGVPPKSVKEPSGFLRVLDVDGDGLISRDEFTTQGRMAYVLSGPKTDPIQRNIPREGEAITVVEFEISSDRSRTGSYSSQEVNLKNLDRYVLWHTGGEITIFQGPIDITRGDEVVVTK